jgi:hypothetical protein
MLVQRRQESFDEGYMAITGFSYNRKLKIRKLEKNIKLNSIAIRNMF